MQLTHICDALIQHAASFLDIVSAISLDAVCKTTRIGKHAMIQIFVMENKKLGFDVLSVLDEDAILRAARCAFRAMNAKWKLVYTVLILKSIVEDDVETFSSILPLFVGKMDDTYFSQYTHFYRMDETDPPEYGLIYDSKEDEDGQDYPHHTPYVTEQVPYVYFGINSSPVMCCSLKEVLRLSSTGRAAYSPPNYSSRIAVQYKQES